MGQPDQYSPSEDSNPEHIPTAAELHESTGIKGNTDVAYGIMEENAVIAAQTLADLLMNSTDQLKAKVAMYIMQFFFGGEAKAEGDWKKLAAQITTSSEAQKGT